MDDPLAVIYNEAQWRINKVTALYNLKDSAVKLKQYSSKIKQTIVSMVTGGPAVKYSVQVEVDPRLKYSEEDADSLMITIFTSQSDKLEKTKLTYRGILVSWGVHNKVPNSVHLPYLLERGEQKLSTAVKSALSAMFDCRITQYNFSQHQLLQFGFDFIDCDTSHPDKNMAFTYNSPLGEHKDKETVRFKIGDVRLMWNSMKAEAKTKADLVRMTYLAVQNMVFEIFGLDITTFDLKEISLPQGAIKNTGTVKMKSPEIVNSLFTTLNRINNHNQS